MSSSGYEVKDSELAFVKRLAASFGETAARVEARDVKQGWGRMVHGAGLIGDQLQINGRVFAWGLAGHADSEITLVSNAPLRRIRGFVGIESNKDTRKMPTRPKVVFSVEDAGKRLWASRPLDLDAGAQELDLQLDDQLQLTLRANADDRDYAHIDWAELTVESTTGEVVKIGDTGAANFAQPVDFVYGAETMNEFVTRNGVEKKQLADGWTSFSSLDARTGLRFELSARAGERLPVCEWRVSFENTSSKPTELLSSVKSLALSLPPAKGALRLLRGRGSFHESEGAFKAKDFKDSFMPVVDLLKDTNNVIEFGAVGGRCSDPWLPFFNVKLPADGGFLVAVGWAGQWKATVSKSRVEAGIERINARLMPGEKISLPAIHLVRYEGDDPMRGNNLLRRYIHEEIAPRHEAKPLPVPACNLTWGGMSEAEHLRRIQNIKDRKIPLDVYWIDAGWYGPEGTISPDEFDSAWGSNAGNWKFNPTILPNGLGKISKAAHEAGLKLLLWIEPERAFTGTAIPTEHPAWFLGARAPGASLLLNLGDQDACDWCIEFVSGMITKQGLDIYREDFNINPLSFWRDNDAPDRQGITEIKAVAGLHRFWGELRRRFPRLLIDNCSSGGRRIDIELLRHSVPLWASDMQCFPGFDPDFAQTHVAGLSLWLPQFAFGVQDERGGDTYNFRSAMAAGVAVHYFSYERRPVTEDYPHEWLRTRLEEFHACKDCFAGDYYSLLEETTQSKKVWSVSQYHRPDLGRGIVLAFRRADSDFTAAKLRLKGLAPDARYELHDFDSGKDWNVTGAALMADGLAMELSTPRSSRLIYYKLSTK